MNDTKRNVRFFNPGLSYAAHREEYLKEIDRVLTAGDLILREDVEKFEVNLAKYVGTKYAVGVASGTDALILSLKALNITGKVLVPSYTFRATVEAVVHAGATPVLYDLDGPTFTSDIQAWIPAHIAGEVPNGFGTKVREARELGITVIEDACQAIGAYPVEGTTACYSFYPAKLLGGFGDAGGIATNDRALYEKLKIMRNHFKGDWGPVGYNSRLDNLQAAILNIKLKYLSKELSIRREFVKMYDEGLLFVKKPVARLVYQDYIIATDDRDGLFDYLKSVGIETMKNGYPFPDIVQKLPLTVAYEDSSLRLPCNGELSYDDIDYIIKHINKYTQTDD